MTGPYVIDDVDVTNTACDEPMQRKIVRDFNGHFHCVYEKNLTIGGLPYRHVWYGFSQDRGVTWTTEDIMDGETITAFESNIVVDSSGVVHVVYKDKLAGFGFGHLKYQYRSGSSWSSPETIYTGIGGSNRTGLFSTGETVRGDISLATGIICYWIGTQLFLLESSRTGTFQVDEWVRGQTSGARMRFKGEPIAALNHPSLAIDSNDKLHVAVSCDHGASGNRVYHLEKSSGGVWTCVDYIGISSAAGTPATTISIDGDDKIHIVTRATASYKYTSGIWGNWIDPEELICTGGSNHKNFSMCVDLDGNVHVALSQTDLGGDNPTTLNIKYYKRTSGGVWSAVEHVTDDGTAREDPSIAVDKNGNIRVVFWGAGYGAETGNPNIVMRTKPSGGSWGSVEVLVDRQPTQYLPNMLHSLLPVSGSERPNCPDGYALIFNGQDTLKVEYLSEIIVEAVKAFPQMYLT